ncbi:MAG: FapA family protein [Helicobacteraceae bacterium]|nr:FapA family protein [Helicobacteraceae bacterium]
MSETQRSKLYSATLEVKTSSIAKSLADLIEREQARPSSVDFDILKIETYIKEPSKDEYAALDKRRLEKLRDKAYLLNPKLELLQEYEVRFKPSSPLPFRFDMALSADRYRSVAHITLKAGSVIKAGVDARSLYLFFNKIKLRNKMMVYICDDALRAAMTRLAQKANGEPFAEDFGFALCAWPQPEPTIDDGLIWRYRDKMQQEREHDRINYADRGFISGVNKDELLVEYIMPKRGTAGRSFDGKFIGAPEPKVQNEPAFTIDAAKIEIVEDNGKRLFFAKEDGYVKLDNNILSIDKVIELTEVSLKTTGNIRAGLDKGVTIRIESKDVSGEAIGVDMVVEATEIYANGGVGSGALVTADKIVIRGQTHQKSELIGKHIEVNVLRGTAQGEEVIVKSLEGGVIRSIDAQIEQVVGGEVKCKTIKASVLRGKACLQAATRITIGQASKGENRLVIDASVEDEDRVIIDEAIETIAKLRTEIDEHRRLRDANALYLSKNLSAFRQVQETIAADRALSRTTGETYLNMAREYKAALRKQEDADARIELLTAQIKTKRRELERFDKMALESEIINESAIWKGHNEAIFKLPFLRREYVQNIDEGMRIKRIKLVESNYDEGEYEIKLFY